MPALGIGLKADGCRYPAAPARFPAAKPMRPSTAAWNWRFHRRVTSGRSIATGTPANTSTLLTWVGPSGNGVKLRLITAGEPLSQDTGDRAAAIAAAAARSGVLAAGAAQATERRASR